MSLKPISQTEFVVYWGGKTPDDAEGRFTFETISEADKLLDAMPTAQLAWRTWTATPWTLQADIPPLTDEDLDRARASAAERRASLFSAARDPERAP